MENFSFENLVVFIKARLLVKKIYLLTAEFPKHELYGLTSQFRRSSISIVSNIAESSGRRGNREKIYFLEIAYGSLTESYSQLIISGDLGYVDSEAIEDLKPLYNEVARLLAGLTKSFECKF